MLHFLSGVDSNLIHYSVLMPAQFSVCALEYVQYVFSNITSIPPYYYLLMRKSESFPTLDEVTFTSDHFPCSSGTRQLLLTQVPCLQNAGTCFGRLAASLQDTILLRSKQFNSLPGFPYSAAESKPVAELGNVNCVNPTENTSANSFFPF